MGTRIEKHGGKRQKEHEAGGRRQEGTCMALSCACLAVVAALIWLASCWFIILFLVRRSCSSAIRRSIRAISSCRQAVTALHRTTLHCTILHCTALYYTALHCTALYCTALFSVKLHCSAPYYSAQRCTAPHLAHGELRPLLCDHVVLLLVELPPVGQLPPQLLQLDNLQWVGARVQRCSGAVVQS